MSFESRMSGHEPSTEVPPTETLFDPTDTRTIRLGERGVAVMPVADEMAKGWLLRIRSGSIKGQPVPVFELHNIVSWEIVNTIHPELMLFDPSGSRRYALASQVNRVARGEPTGFGSRALFVSRIDVATAEVDVHPGRGFEFVELDEKNLPMRPLREIE